MHKLGIIPDGRQISGEEKGDSPWDTNAGRLMSGSKLAARLGSFEVVEILFVCLSDLITVGSLLGV
jgi:hypothetical protein